MVADAFIMPSVLTEPPLVAITVALALRVASGSTLTIAKATDVAEPAFASTAEQEPPLTAVTVAEPAV